MFGPRRRRFHHRAALALGALVATLLVAACSSLRDGPLTGAGASPRDAAALRDGKTLEDGGVIPEDDAGAADAQPPEHDPEWAMWRLPPSAPAAGNYAVANGVALDETTRLEWMQDALPAKQTHAGALSACTSATLGGGGFRLPTRIELLSLVDYSINGKGMNTSVFGATSFAVEFWSSTPDALASSSRAWFVRFANGESTTDERSTMKSVRCVRGPV